MAEEYICKAVTVYCSSSNHVDSSYLDTARELGRLLAAGGYTLVFGGGRVGLMGALSSEARGNGGTVVGVILKKFKEIGAADPGVENMQTVEDMRRRKEGLERAGDAYIALPGGFGTFEEITEIISFKQLGFHNKPIVFVNVNGYFEHLLRQFEIGFNEKFIETRFRSIFEVVSSAPEAIDAIKKYQPLDHELKYRWPLKV